MNNSGVVVWAMCMVLIVGIVISFIYIIVPINLKYQFNDICSDYNYKALVEGGLTVEDKNHLKERLIERGYFDINIITSNKDESSFAKSIKFIVKCKTKYVITVGLLKYKTAEGNLKYEKYSFSKKVVN
ncbi:hypothetical protein [Helicovermis profundi]|uniref:Uncharacterized protein n=1 Tax=Helicovermis profundi TaxID=3065157 RepID=A0AAU9ESP0_9FIRM|nr:hypothetical protein HLPR_27570 [Clostridia bacterium S502]